MTHFSYDMGLLIIENIWFLSVKFPWCVLIHFMAFYYILTIQNQWAIFLQVETISNNYDDGSQW